MSRREPFICDENAGHVISAINRMAASFDVAALSIEEVVSLDELLARCMGMLWHEHSHVLAPLYRLMQESLDWFNDDLDGGATDSSVTRQAPTDTCHPSLRCPCLRSRGLACITGVELAQRRRRTTTGRLSSPGELDSSR